MWTCRWEGGRWDRQVKARRESGRGRSDDGLTWAGGVGEGAHPKSHESSRAHVRTHEASTRACSRMQAHATAGAMTVIRTRCERTPHPSAVRVCVRLWWRCGVSWGEAGAGGAYLEMRRGRRDGEAPHTAPLPAAPSHSHLVRASRASRRTQERTALHRAAERGHTVIVAALVAAGSDVGAKDVSGVRGGERRVSGDVSGWANTGQICYSPGTCSMSGWSNTGQTW